MKKLYLLLPLLFMLLMPLTTYTNTSPDAVEQDYEIVSTADLTADFDVATLEIFRTPTVPEPRELAPYLKSNAKISPLIKSGISIEAANYFIRSRNICRIECEPVVEVATFYSSKDGRWRHAKNKDMQTATNWTTELIN